MEGIPEYFNALEDTHKRSKRAGKPITEDTILLIATNAMLSTERYPRVDNSWEDLPKKDFFWPDWKNLYKSADRKAKVKKQAMGGQDQFGAAHGALRQAPEPEQTNQANSLNRSVTDLNEYFDVLAAAATMEKTVLE